MCVCVRGIRNWKLKVDILPEHPGEHETSCIPDFDDDLSKSHSTYDMGQSRLCSPI